MVQRRVVRRKVFKQVDMWQIKFNLGKGKVLHACQKLNISAG